jgi:phage-related protein
MAERALATAYVNIVPGTKAVEQYLKSGLGEQAAGAGQQAGGKFGSSFKNRFSGVMRGFAAPLIGAVSVAGVSQFLTGAVQGASDLNEQLSATRTVFGDGSKIIEKFASGAADKLGQTRTQIFEASKSFGVFGKAAGLGEKDNAKFSTSLVSLATDLASFNNTSVDEALMALSAGLRGESEPLRRYGVLLSENTLKAQALKMGLINSTKEALSPQNKVLAANAAIFEQTKTQQGDFARTSDGLANQQRILSAAFADAQASLGEALLPTMTNFVSFLNTSVIPVVSQFFEDFKAGKTPLNDVLNSISAVFNFIKDNWTWISTLSVAIGTLVAGWKLYNGALLLWQNITKIGIAIQAAWNVVMAANPIVLVIIAVTALVAALVWFFTQTKVGQQIWKAFTDFIGTAIKAVGAFFGQVWAGIVGYFKGQVKLMSGIWNGIVRFFTDTGKKISNFFSGVWDGIADTFTGVFDFIANAFKGYVNTWIGLINWIIGGLNTIQMDVPDWVPMFGGQTWGINIPKVPMLAKGGFVDKPTTAIIGEAGPEVVTPLRDFERMMGLGEKSASDRPIYADGIGLLGWLREEAKGQATLVFNTEISSITRGAR